MFTHRQISQFLSLVPICYGGQPDGPLECENTLQKDEVLAVPPLFLQESGHSGGIPVDSGGMKFSRGPC